MNSKTLLIAFIFSIFISGVCTAQEASVLLNSSPEKENEAPDFKKSRDKLIDFHMLKVEDHQKVVDCLRGSKNFKSMNDCNIHIKKYLKKVEEIQVKDEKTE